MAQRDDRARYWAEVIGQFQDSGLSRAEFCRRQGIRPKSLGNWLHKRAFRQQVEQVWAEQTTTVEPKPRFLPEVTTPTGPTSPNGSERDGSGMIDLILGPNRRLAITTGFDAGTLHRLLDLLEARP